MNYLLLLTVSKKTFKIKVQSDPFPECLGFYHQFKVGNSRKEFLLFFFYLYGIIFSFFSYYVNTK